MPADVIASRSIYLQNTNIERHTINFSDANIGSFRHIGTISVGSFIISAKAYVTTAFNAGTTNVLTVGTTFGNANELFAAGDITPGTVGYYEGNKGRGLALTAVGSPMEFQPNGTSVDTTEGGVGLYAKYTQTGAAATAGQVVVVIEYAPPNNT